ncbi:glycosyltransferase [Cellulosimicrobium cellulans]|uniref:glycosyltransferase n=1 Tax=Cellulosimicrobium cellulans TaxID=1710 RepID=UPI0009F42FAA|nr:glycosyltransferase [Cellulosimicrobium cellulans]
MATRPRMLILAFSPLAGDARVLKQIRHFAASYDVTTCGYGPRPLKGVEHLELPAHARNRLDGRLVTTRVYPLVHRAIPAVRAARTLLAGRRFDVVIANDLETAPIAFDVAAPERVLVDLHEYFPRLHEDDAAWMRRIAPYQRWLTRRFAARAGAVTTVSHGLADSYRDELGLECRVVTNAAPYADLSPRPVERPVRLVHSGACLRSRNLMLMLDAVESASTDVTLDLYLTPNHPDYLEELRSRAATIPGVTVREPVPYDSLVRRLNEYDVGVFVLPPVTASYASALPNKFFDFVQARLGLVVGPTPEMASLVRDLALGVVTDDFSAVALSDAIDRLDPDSVATFKARSNASARPLAADAQIAVWDEIVGRLAGPSAA